MKDIELMEHADGELDDKSADRVRALLDKDPDARAKVESIAQIGEVVRGHLELTSDDVLDRRFQNMWREIDKHLDRYAARRPGETAVVVLEPRGEGGGSAGPGASAPAD